MDFARSFGAARRRGAVGWRTVIVCVVAMGLLGGAARAQPSAPRPDKTGRFQNDYFIVALPRAWRFEHGSRRTAGFAQRHGAARIQATAFSNVDTAVYTRRLRTRLEHDASVHVVSVRHVPFGVRGATRLDFLRGPLREIVFVVEGAGSTVHIQIDVPKARYAGLSRFPKQLGDYFGFVDND
jgi:hypothetical protein